MVMFLIKRKITMGLHRCMQEDCEGANKGLTT